MVPSSRSLTGPEGFAGFMIALFLLTGRWSFARLQADAYGGQTSEPRLWIGAILLALWLLPIGRPMISRVFKQEARDVRKLTRLMLVFLAYMMVTAAWAPDRTLALLKLYELALIMIAILSLHKMLVCFDSELVRTAFWKSVVLITGLLAVLAIGQMETISSQRVAVLGGGPNVFGRMMGLMCLGSLFMWQRGGRSWLWLSVSTIAFLLVILSGSRGAFVAVTVSLFVFLAVERVRLTRMVPLGVTAVAVAGLVLLYTPLGAAAQAMYRHRIVFLLIEQLYTTHRTELYSAAYDLGMRHPLVGAGLASFPAITLAPYAHNIFLETFSEGGIVGLCVIALLIVTALRILWNNRGHLDGAIVAALALVLIASQFSGDLYDSRGVFLFMLLSAFPRPRSGEGDGSVIETAG